MLIPSIQALEAAVSRIEKGTLRPMQKEAFLCQASCCDSAEDLNTCCNRCQAQVSAAETLVDQQMAQFQVDSFSSPEYG